MKSLYGVFGAVGTWPDWQRFFEIERGGMVRSFLSLLLCYPALWLVQTGIEAERARLLDTDVPQGSVGLFIAIITIWLLSFTATAGATAMLLGKTDRLPLWFAARNWSLVWICVALGAIFAAIRWLGLPFALGNGALFAAYLGLLPIDIRLAIRAVGLPLGTAVLVACVIVSTSLLALLSGAQLALG